MKISEEKLTKNKHKILMTIYMSIPFIGCFAFPIIPTNLEPYESFPIYLTILLFVMRFQLIYVCVYMGKLLSIMQASRKLYIFLSMFGLNFLGFLIRLAMEWGESTMMKELTIMNIVIHLLILPLLILIIYIKESERRSVERAKML